MLTDISCNVRQVFKHKYGHFDIFDISFSEKQYVLFVDLALKSRRNESGTTGMITIGK